MSRPSPISGNGRPSSNGADPDTHYPAILLVDDDPRDLQAMEELLKRHGFRVTAVRTFDEALRRLEGERYAAIVADYRLGSGSHDGFELLKRAQSMVPKTVRLIVTSDVQGAVLAEACEGQWVSKDQDAAATLPAKIREALARLTSGT